MMENKSKPQKDRTLRYYINPYDDYDAENNILRYGKIYPEVVAAIDQVARLWIDKILRSQSLIKDSNYTVYKGTCGIAMLCFLIAKKRRNYLYLDRGIAIIEKSLPLLKNRLGAFLNGDAGPLALGAVMYSLMGQPTEALELVERLIEISSLILNRYKLNVSDELSYGRAGYLFALLFVNKHMGKGTIDEHLIRKVVSLILVSGKNRAIIDDKHVPLMYAWQGKNYLGASHGMAGILFQLLQAKNYMELSDLHDLVKPTIDYLECLVLPSGNFPSSLGSKYDRLVQWCHGAPGIIHLFILAYQVFKKDHYLNTALKCGEVVWERGILTKSYCLCHGAAGNAYAFLSLYNATKNPLHLHRACRFAEWCTTYGTFQTREPDSPLSLFEGIAGAAYFLIDLLYGPNNARFPGFAL